jgi:hypothetical protein
MEQKTRVNMRHRLLLLFCICFLIYFLVDWFFTDFFLYFIGGLIGSLVKVFFSISDPIFVFLIWTVLLIILVFMYIRISMNIIVNIFIILAIAILFSIVDAIFYEFLGIIESEWSKYLHLGVSVLCKSLLLSLVIYSKRGSLKFFN